MLNVQDFLPDAYKKDQGNAATEIDAVPPLQGASVKSQRPTSFSHDDQPVTAPPRRNKKRSILLAAFLLLLVAGSAVGLFLMQQNQDVRQQAYIEDGGPCDNSSTTAAVCRGLTAGAIVYSCGWQTPNQGLKCVRTTGTYCAAVAFDNTGNCSGTNPPPTGGTCTNTGRPFAQCIKFTCANGCDQNGRCGESRATSTVRGPCAGLLASCQPGSCCQVDAIDDQGTYCILPGFTEKVICSLSCGGGGTPPPSNPPTTVPPTTPPPTTPPPSSPPPTTPPPTTPPVTPSQIVCKSIALLNANNQVITGSGDSSLRIGDQIKLRCNSSDDERQGLGFQFRILDSAGNWTYLNPDPAAARNISEPYTIETTGRFIAQSRVCVASPNPCPSGMYCIMGFVPVCQDWENVPEGLIEPINCEIKHECPLNQNCSESRCQ